MTPSTTWMTILSGFVIHISVIAKKTNIIKYQCCWVFFSVSPISINKQCPLSAFPRSHANNNQHEHIMMINDHSKTLHVSWVSSSSRRPRGHCLFVLLPFVSRYHLDEGFGWSCGWRWAAKICVRTWVVQYIHGGTAKCPYENSPVLFRLGSTTNEPKWFQIENAVHWLTRRPVKL